MELGSPVRTHLETLFQSSITKHRPWTGAPHCAAPKLIVERIERIFAPHLQDKYIAELQDLAGLCERKVQAIPVPPHSVPVQTFQGLQLNEFLLFHGLPSHIVQRVELQGLDPRYAGSHFGKLFGHGIYTATNASKSDIYTTADAAGLRCMLVVRTCLGEPHMAAQACPDLLRPPERRDGRGPLSSVVALTQGNGGVVEHPEYIVYKETQALPEYMIYYRHGAGCACTHCAKKLKIYVSVEGLSQRIELTIMEHFTMAYVGRLVYDKLPVAFQRHTCLNAHATAPFQFRSSSGTSIITTRTLMLVPAGGTVLACLISPAVYVRTLSGNIMALKFDHSDSVLDLKAKIYDASGTPADRQRLIFLGRQLVDDALLSDCGIQKESTVHLVPAALTVSTAS